MGVICQNMGGHMATCGCHMAVYGYIVCQIELKEMVVGHWTWLLHPVELQRYHLVSQRCMAHHPCWKDGTKGKTSALL